MGALVRYARTGPEQEWDAWWFAAARWQLMPWWRRMFHRRPKLPGYAGARPW